MAIFRAKDQALPNLKEYLANLTRNRGNTALGPIIVGFFFLLAGLALAIPRALGSFAGFLAVALAVVVGAGVYARLNRRKLDPGRAKTRLEAMQVAIAMTRSKRLHKDLDAPSAQLLDEAARFWRDTRVELDTPFWRNPKLPEHWKNVRIQTLSATDQAMEEMLVLLRGSFHERPDQHGWETVVESAIETFVTGPQLRKGDNIPPGFHEARQIAEKLKLAAGQVRAASQEVVAETGETPLISSGAALDMVIGDMRSLQEAEQELRRNLNA